MQHSIHRFGKVSSGHRTGKGPIPKKGSAKECSNYCTFVLISHASRVVLKIHQTGLQQCVNQELQMYKLDLEKAEKPEIKLLTFIGSWRKQRSSRKTSVSLITLKPLTMWIITNYGKFLKRWECQTTWLVFWETCMWVKKRYHFASSVWSKLWFFQKSCVDVSLGP